MLAQLNEKIRALRQYRHWTQEELAWKLGISRVTLNNIEHGAIGDLSLELIIKFCFIMGCSSDYLLSTGGNYLLDLQGVEEDSVLVLNNLVNHLRSKNI